MLEIVTRYCFRVHNINAQTDQKAQEAFQHAGAICLPFHGRAEAAHNVVIGGEFSFLSCLLSSPFGCLCRN